jgi:hypothetical protein
MLPFCKCKCHSFTLYIYLMQSLHHTILDLCRYLIMQSYLWQMVRTRTSEDPLLDIPESSVGRRRGQAPRGNATPPPPRPPVSLEQLLAMQNDLMRLLMENEMHRRADHLQPQQQDRNSSYSNFLATHLPLFFEATDPLV